MRPRHHENHFTQRIGWLRAAVLGANDGIISTASLILGVAAAHASREAILTAGVASLVAGSMSMAAGEYVSVSSQADMEKAETETERKELETNHLAEHKELANIYAKRGLTAHLADQVATQLMAHDALDAHLRDELGISETLKAQPLQAASASAITYAIGAVLPLLSLFISTPSTVTIIVPLVSLIVLTLLGGLAASAGGANVVKGALRVLFWGAIAMAVTAGIGALFGTVA
ncbi:MAG: VIT family protein [Xanthomonadales bacterium PRO7]|jgi:VIT1/CCC1 family predicted Fe2+/Mn2+ transporter|nr:VIT family protein [Xanthomonadales bacterium PRO7]